MNIRDNKFMPDTIITRDRKRGNYTIKACLNAPSITKDKATRLEYLVNRAIREVGLIGVAQLDYKISKK
jgi:hypothetical protein